MFDVIENALLTNEYHALEANREVPGYRIFVDSSRGLLNAVVFVDILYYKKEYLQEFKESLIANLSRGNITAHVFRVALVNSLRPGFDLEMEKAREICLEDPFTWIFDLAKNELIVYETQVEDFYGLRRILNDAESFPKIQEEKESFKDYCKSILESIKQVPKVTVSLVFINIVVFIICTFTGSLLYNKGGLALDLVLGDKDYYRIISSMFLHVNVTHIFGNMVLLYFLGEVVEERIGKLAFFIFYILSGIAGGLLQIYLEPSALVVGASGAAFGILGILFPLVLFRRVKKSTMTPGRIMSVIVFSLFDGFADPNIAIYAHLGGLATGVLLGILFCIFTKQRKSV